MATPPQGYGRGGRGALLAALSQKETRRPGQGDGSSTEKKIEGAPTPPLVLGRGALGRLLLSQAAQASSRVVTPSVPQIGRGILGKGTGISLGRGILGVQSLSTPVGAKFATTTKTISPISEVQPSPASSSLSQTELSVPEGKLSKLSLKDHKGEAGKPLDLEVNYLRLKAIPGMGVFEYHVSFNPSVDSKNIRFRLLNQADIEEVIGKTKTFDGAKLYLPHKLQDPMTALSTKLPTDGSAVTLYFKFIGQVKPEDCIHLFNVLFRKIMLTLKMTQVGRNYFDPKGGIAIPQHKLEVWPGYVTSIQMYEGGLLLNCDASFRILRTVTAIDVLMDIVKMARRNEQDFRELAVKQLIGSVVLTRYNNKTYRVDDVAWDLNPCKTFTTHSGNEISFMEYYKRSYDIQIQDENQPLLIHRPKPKKGDPREEMSKFICLVPELCYMTGLTDDMRSDFKVMKDIAVHTRVTPNQRQAALQQFINNINTNSEAKQMLADWGVSVESGIVAVGGRLLPSEKLLMKNKSFYTNPEADWGRNITKEAVISAVHLNNWLVIVSKRDGCKANDFITMMKKVCPSMGINICEPVRLTLKDDRTESYLRALRDNVNQQVQVVVIIFPTSRDDRYSAIKKLCCIDMPVPSQVINARTISNHQKLRSVTQKIILQINCKLGGELWALEIPIRERTMICGIDVYHDISRGGKSVLGFVSSLNQSFTRWFSRPAFQQSGQEIIDCLKLAFLGALRKYYEVNHDLPKKIFIFRDGVSHSQMKHIAEYEVEQVSSCFQHFGESYEPTLSVLVVQKRINTRIFLSLNGRGHKSLDNPPSGTILDHTVTQQNWYDFFLVSQHVRQGTVTPTHYVVIYDSSNMRPDWMQRLTYKLTHLYYNWPGTIRVPAPCQYAHKLACLVGQNLHKDPSVELSDKLFYL
ncbi:piwi-like protein 1 [Tachypleus tridentatus]|uniref:piwi-like protein 1 n=2 Tax=Tachypleus tridentatus TaxID=6853 RepID=UPI003FD15F3D